MATKKQARAAQRRRHEQHEARLAARAARRHRTRQIAAAVTVVTLVLGGGALAIVTSGKGGGEPTPGATPSATPGATPGATPSATKPIIGPPPDLAENRDWTATIDTNQGPITLTLDGAAAPQAVASFIYLARDGFFEGTSCHRLVTQGIYVLQCGDPTGTGTGGPDYRFGPVENAPADNLYPAGTLAMARARDDGFSMGSQFFIVYQDSFIPSDSAGGYTVFGTVTDGLGRVEAIAAAGTETGGSDGPPALPVVINEVTAQ